MVRAGLTVQVVPRWIAHSNHRMVNKDRGDQIAVPTVSSLSRTKPQMATALTWWGRRAVQARYSMAAHNC